MIALDRTHSDLLKFLDLDPEYRAVLVILISCSEAAIDVLPRGAHHRKDDGVTPADVRGLLRDIVGLSSKAGSSSTSIHGLLVESGKANEEVQSFTRDLQLMVEVFHELAQSLNRPGWTSDTAAMVASIVDECEKLFSQLDTYKVQWNTLWATNRRRRISVVLEYPDMEDLHAQTVGNMLALVMLAKSK